MRKALYGTVLAVLVADVVLLSRAARSRIAALRDQVQQLEQAHDEDQGIIDSWCEYSHDMDQLVAAARRDLPQFNAWLINLDAIQAKNFAF